MWWTYVIVAITFMVIGFVLCALLSANKIEEEDYITIEEILRRKEEENEDE